MLVLKHMARELSLDPYKLRKVLRVKFGKRRSWRWDTDKVRERQDYDRCISHVRKMIMKKESRNG